MPNVPPRPARRTIGEFDRDIDSLIAAAGDLGRCLPAFAGALSAFLDGADVTLHVYEEEDDELVLRGSTRRISFAGESPRFPADGTVPGLAMAERRTVSLTEDARAPGGKLRAEEHVFPLTAGSRALGAVTVVRVAAERLSPVRLDRVRRGVLRFGEALAKARDEEVLSRRMNRLSAINEFGVILVSTLGLEEVPALATAMTSFIMGTEGCILRLRDEKAQGSSVRDAHGLRDAASSREILRLEARAAELVLRTGKVLLVRDAARDERFSDAAARVRTFICVPLTGAAGTIGTLTLFNKDPESALAPARFGPDDQEVLQHLVRYVEKAIANATLLAKTRELSERDELTGLPDRASFRSRLLSEISRARRFHLRIGLVICEVQPPAEDAAGGRTTEEMVRGAAQAIRAALRDYDTVARISDRAFGIILPQMQNGTASPIARIQTAIEKEIEQHRTAGGAPDVRVRFSHASFPDDGTSGEQILSRLEHTG
ncbi:MAG TPA: diguanylate cyclase [Candidatus Methanoperedens sp.]|nr:diguanylate cyclase [Candidatus Methanoperedens sp.]